jgi:hypothetical protein
MLGRHIAAEAPAYELTAADSAAAAAERVSPLAQGVFD